MILKTSVGDPITVSINGQPPSTVKMRLVTHKIVGDSDMKDFQSEMLLGRDIVCHIQAKDCSYIMTRELLPVKIALPNQPGTGLKI